MFIASKNTAQRASKRERNRQPASRVSMGCSAVIVSVMTCAPCLVVGLLLGGVAVLALVLHLGLATAWGQRLVVSCYWVSVWVFLVLCSLLCSAHCGPPTPSRCGVGA